jgi:hypothetical protein
MNIIDNPFFLSWLEKWQNLITDDYKTNYTNLIIPQLEVKEGKKYLKIVYGGSVHAFVDKITGDIYKAATWAAPAKHVRGNIFSEQNGMENMNVYGPAYLR